MADVDSYRHFVPYCTASKVLNSRSVESPGNGRTTLKEAELTVGFLTFKDSYISNVTCTPYISVEVRLISSLSGVNRTNLRLFRSYTKLHM